MRAHFLAYTLPLIDVTSRFLSSGYFVYDSLVMAIYPKYCEAEMGKSGALPPPRPSDDQVNPS